MFSHMNKRGLFTLKIRKGEARENPLDPRTTGQKLTAGNLINLYRKEKKEVHIVFESTF